MTVKSGSVQENYSISKLSGLWFEQSLLIINQSFWFFPPQNVTCQGIWLQTDHNHVPYLENFSRNLAVVEQNFLLPLLPNTFWSTGSGQHRPELSRASVALYSAPTKFWRGNVTFSKGPCWIGSFWQWLVLCYCFRNYILVQLKAETLEAVYTCAQKFHLCFKAWPAYSWLCVALCKQCSLTEKILFWAKKEAGNKIGQVCPRFPLWIWGSNSFSMLFIPCFWNESDTSPGSFKGNTHKWLMCSINHDWAAENWLRTQHKSAN